MRQSLTFVFVILSVAATGQTMNSDAWVKMISANAIKAGSNNNFLPAHPGYALYFSKAGNVNAPYIIYVPQGYNPLHTTKLVVFLHGAILARDSFHHKDPAIADEPIFSIGDSYNTIVVFPFCKSGFAWPQQSACDNVMNIIAQAEQHYNIDKKRVYIGGISMGGISTFWFINNRPGDFAGFYTFSALPRLNVPVRFSNITKQHPLYSMNAQDDPVFPYNEVHELYEEHKHEAPGWMFRSIPEGGHRFIYSKGGTKYVKELLGDLLKN